MISLKKLNTIASILIFFFLLLYTVIALGQNNQETQYLLSGKNIKISGFGGPTLSFSQITNEPAVLTGGGGAVLFNQTFFAGIFGEGLSSDHRLKQLQMENDFGNISTFYDVRTDFGYGGLWLGYIHQPKNAVHFGLSTKIGWGSISLAERDYHIDWHDNIMNDVVFVFNPQAEIELNLYRWFKLNIGVGYRFVSGLDKTYVNQLGQEKKYFQNTDFSQPHATIGLLFGGFGK
ncbi:MAG: hypothetical protein H6541_02475 [Lentimicrobiaceae bacterium]|nr:hypothetical protein [Lentimicrobiaceae bacterium]MCB9023516.1 hypothetical protein [Lentimicrobiaceae bacterium]MCO5267168.1 hypothetical protein [Lentimicrobium sp.]HPG32847.1 hypothetical protein [Lentimicrobium sp.]